LIFIIVGQFAIIYFLQYVPPLFKKISFGDKWHGFFSGQMPFPSPYQQYQGTEGDTKHLS